MKNIKFRVWNNFQKRYNTLQYEALNGNINPIDNVLVHSKECVIEQYTGLKDKNGVEIYDGDKLSNGEFTMIVRFSEYEHGWGGDTHIGVYVEHDKSYDRHQTYRRDIIFWLNERNCEVIGNIHESE